MDFHNMLITGMNVNQIVNALEETTQDKLLRQALPKISAEIDAGSSIKKAFEYALCFPRIVHSTLSAGEYAGRLNDVTLILAQYFKRRDEIKGKVLNATIYPLAVFVFLFGTMLFISFTVIPKLHAFLPSSALRNPVTQCMLTLVDIITKFGALIVAVIFTSVCVLMHYCKNHPIDAEFYSYRIPLLGKLLKESALALYFLNLSVLLRSGIPLIKAMSHMDISPISRKFSSCKDYMLGGLSLSEAVKLDLFFPMVISLSLRRAEETAKIEEYCMNLSEYFDQRVRNWSDQAAHLFQPALLLCGGLFLITIAFAFLVPIYGSLSVISDGG